MNKKINIWLVVIIVVLAIGSSILSSTMYWNSKHRTVLKEQKQTLLDSIATSQEKEDKLLTDSKKATNNVIKKIKSIDDKLKTDEEIIDTRDVSDADIDSLLTRFD